jgi:isoleucyl-tRNA synthetase
LTFSEQLQPVTCERDDRLAAVGSDEMFKEVPVTVSFPDLERSVLEKWESARVFEASVERRRGATTYVFYDGPPFATGLPHYGHILTSYIKDVVPRYFTMRGFHVPRRWGWDCHGLPVEYEVEKLLGFRGKSEILHYGVDRFNAGCRSLVLRYASEWERIINRLGRWVDFEHAYRTMDLAYMESVIACFKRLHELGYVYEGSKVVAYCVRCQTPLSNFEARLDDSFRVRRDMAATVRFRLRASPHESFLAWTTTPWTLPANVALAVGPEVDYSRLEGNGESVWLATAAVSRYERELNGYTEKERAFGATLIDRQYSPLFDFAVDAPNAFRVLAADFVSTAEGTGIVHLAPAYGEDDNALCAALGISGPSPVMDDGRYDESVGPYSGQDIFAANHHIVRDLNQRGAVLHRAPYEHNYPHCWRCDNPLIYRAVSNWFVRVSGLTERLLAANEQINWVPQHIKHGRFGKWLEGARDWAVSRSRFWGAPIPVWRCADCRNMDVIGSLEELRQKSSQEIRSLHRPEIDEVTYACAACGGRMQRVPDVLDCWFESGSMPYAQVHYPFEAKEEFERSFPGDFIVEYKAQTRGWFYTLVVLAGALFDKPPFRNVVCHGVILGHDGRKMSKRLQNYPDPTELVEQHGSDGLRIALLSSAVAKGEDIRFAPEAVRDAVRRFCIPLWNSLHYFTSYARIDGFVPTGRLGELSRLDQYLLHETEALRATIEERMESYDFAGVYAAIEEYITLLSTWYIRLTKPRLWREGEDGDKQTAYEVLYASLETATQLTAPFIPFFAESAWEVLGGSESVHLQDWPHASPAWYFPEVASEMRAVRTVVWLARGIRERAGIKHRHPLRSVSIAGVPAHTIENNLQVLMDELNVKEVKVLENAENLVRKDVKVDARKAGKRLTSKFKEVLLRVKGGDYALGADGSLQVGDNVLLPDEYDFTYVAQDPQSGVAVHHKVVVSLDLTIDSELVLEGYARDLNREIQDLRKRARLAYSDRIIVSLSQSDTGDAVLERYKSWLTEQTLAREIINNELGEALASTKLEIGDAQVNISIAAAGR